eukprot:TRINITY_DN9253_c0_g1_i1.p1 TRINITY_DN9253_c0_g1~~TRINITY_DN9253_c0_g1_i1.p1  ORF type:complete len:330 (-),score=27.73 TRINITY_DN9253_c0_g1_i1:259-1248(-)
MVLFNIFKLKSSPFRLRNNAISMSFSTESKILSFIPPEGITLGQNEWRNLIGFVKSKKKLVVLTGAGISTESGIPDYRSPNGSYSKGHKPITYNEFINNTTARKRYWARNMYGFPFFSRIQPNLAHIALAKMENESLVHHVITQNVDRLHQKAGNRNVIELHGHSFGVMCLACKSEIPRADFQEALESNNPTWKHKITARPGDSRPDFDVELGNNVNYEEFVVPACTICGSGPVRPMFVFMGENVAKEKVQNVMDIVSESDGLLVLGSSLQVYSAFRFVRAAYEKQIPIAAINIGPTRADDMIKLKIEARCGEVIPQLAAALLEGKMPT